jgi:hypothetical protein
MLERNMPDEKWFDVPVIGDLAAVEAAPLLRDIGEGELADQMEQQESMSVKLFGWGGPKPWQHTAHAFGYVAPGGSNADELPILMAGKIVADETLRKSRIKITLDRLRIADYPGGGMHHVLFDFYAQNQSESGVEQLHFNSTFRAQEGEQAGVVGFPIFVGLNVGDQGVAFRCFTVNVKNDNDESFLAFLESDTFRSGLKLANTAQPALAPLSEMAFALTKAIAQRNRNVPVQDFYLGLDFSNIATRAKLAEGSYIAVQIPETMETLWNWSDWVFHTGSGQVVRSGASKELIPYNYAVFSISRM